MTLGGNLSVSAGPFGRNAEASISAQMSPIYSYSKSKGLFGGISVEGSVIIERKETNCKYYKRDICAKDILSGAVEPPEIAKSLYRALDNRVAAGGGVTYLSNEEYSANGATFSSSKYANNVENYMPAPQNDIPSQKINPPQRPPVFKPPAMRKPVPQIPNSSSQSNTFVEHAANNPELTKQAVTAAYNNRSTIREIVGKFENNRDDYQVKNLEGNSNGSGNSMAGVAASLAYNNPDLTKQAAVAAYSNRSTIQELSGKLGNANLNASNNSKQNDAMMQPGNTTSLRISNPWENNIETEDQNQKLAPAPKKPMIPKKPMNLTRQTVAVAMFDYVPDSSASANDLQFVKGDLITVIDSTSGPWWKGSLNGKTGEVYSF